MSGVLSPLVSGLRTLNVVKIPSDDQMVQFKIVFNYMNYVESLILIEKLFSIREPLAHKF